MNLEGKSDREIFNTIKAYYAMWKAKELGIRHLLGAENIISFPTSKKLL